MSRRAGSRKADDTVGSPESNKRWWVFPVVAGVIVAFWLVMSLPRVESSQGESMPYTTKRAGWPDHFSRWSVAKDTGETTYSSFSTGALLGNLVVMAVPIVAAWFITRHLTRQPGETPDQATVRHRRAPPSSGKPTGGWG